MRRMRFTLTKAKIRILLGMGDGVHMARRITVPIQELAEGTRAVASGNLDYRVQVEADDEIGILVDSFNRMTGDLGRSEVELTETNRNLQRTNVELNERRVYMETVLESIGAGVFSLDGEGQLNTVNRAASRMLDLDPRAALHRHYRAVFASDPLTPLCHLMDRMVREGRGTVNEQVSLSLLGRGGDLRGQCLEPEGSGRTIPRHGRGL